MKSAERVVIVLIITIIFGGVFWVYSVIESDRKELREAVARGEYEIPDIEYQHIDESDWREVYPLTTPMFIGGVQVEASVADDLDERIKGLSGTPFIPENVIKLFVFGSYGSHSIWMKDMNYSIDVLWADRSGEIVHVYENMTPESFPQSFGSPIPAWFVIEAKAGFVAKHGIEVGDMIQLP
jgi:uncharacterized membrane protein (UPF0127 family)